MTWTAPQPVRLDPPDVADERPMLDGWLDFHRQTLLSKCAGLDADQLRIAAVEPSGLTLHGLVRHMADVERWWFRKMAAGQDITDIYGTEADPDNDFNGTAGADPEVDFGIFAEEVAAARAVAAELPLEHTFVSRRGKDLSLRWVYVHMIEEYARHNGHADLLRERIDGVTGE